MEIYIWVGAVSLVGSGFGAFFGAYLKKKGENLATHEDIDKVVLQMSAVTQATKDIEAKISNDVWDRQRRWEMKRDAPFALAQKLQAMENALHSIHSTYAAAAKDSANETYLHHKSQALDKWSEASDSFAAAHLQADLVCRDGVKQATHRANLLIRRQAHELIEGNVQRYIQSLPGLVAATSAVSSEIRKELGIDEASTAISIKAASL
jgi:hypothetical protein